MSKNLIHYDQSNEERKLIVLLIYKQSIHGFSISDRVIADIIDNFKDFNAVADTLTIMASYRTFDVMTNQFIYEVYVDRIFHRTLFFHIDIKPIDLKNGAKSIYQLIREGLDEREGKTPKRHPCLVKRFKIVLPYLKLC